MEAPDPVVWEPAPADAFALQPRQVHLWRFGLSEPGLPRSADLLASLSPDEQRRADSFRRGRDRDRFLAGRGLLRVLLGGYLGTSPARLRFSYGVHGKPELVPRHSAADLHFNLSHSDDLVLIALARGLQVGVDVEWVRPGFPIEELASRFLTPDEAERLGTISGLARKRALYLRWTCKEAVLKARGEGLGTSPKQVVLHPAPSVPSIVRGTYRSRPGSAEEQPWWIRLFAPEPDYVAAVAAEGRPDRFWFCEGTSLFAPSPSRKTTAFPAADRAAPGSRSASRPALRGGGGSPGRW